MLIPSISLNNSNFLLLSKQRGQYQHKDMDNLFPYFQSFAVDSTETNTCRGESGWAPQSTIDQSKLQNNKKLLAGKGHRSKTLSDKKSPRRPRPAPNDRDASFVLEELSPLCEAERCNFWCLSYLRGTFQLNFVRFSCLNML